MMKIPHLPTSVYLLLLIFMGLFLYALDPAQYFYYPKCPFRLLTGWSCPSCGIQRALHSILHGDLSTALRYNLFLILSLPYFLILLNGQRCKPHSIGKTLFRYASHRYTIYLYLTGYLLWGITRNLLHI